jgi:hypothetical protein
MKGPLLTLFLTLFVSGASLSQDLLQAQGATALERLEGLMLIKQRADQGRALRENKKWGDHGKKMAENRKWMETGRRLIAWTPMMKRIQESSSDFWYPLLISEAPSRWSAGGINLQNTMELLAQGKEPSELELITLEASVQSKNRRELIKQKNKKKLN